MAALSVIVPVYRGGTAFEACLQALHGALRDGDELIVVADGDQSDDRRIAERLGVRVVACRPRRGPAAARNAGARAARHGVLVFVDADVRVRRDTLDRFRRALGPVGTPDAPDAVFGSYDDTPADPGFLSQYRNLLHHFIHQQARPESSSFWAGCGAVRRTAFAAVGGFDRRWTAPGVEDVELGYRLCAAGYRIRLLKDVQVQHLKAWTARTMIATDVWRRGVPWTELLLRHRRFDRDLNLRLSDRFSVVAAWATALGLGAAAAGLPAAGLGLAVLGLGGLGALNAGFFTFLARRRGAAFALRAVPWHVLFYAYNGVAFLLGLGRHLIRTAGPGTGAAPIFERGRSV